MKSIVANILGGQIPKGTISVSGAKNSATRLLAASSIADGIVTLRNFPSELVDAIYKINFLKEIGCDIKLDNVNETVEIDSKGISSVVLDSYNYPIRTTYLLAAGQIKRNGVARIPYPGGCNLGNRGYDLHIMVWERLGAKVIEHTNYIEISAPNGFKPNDISFPITTIGGTENALICASITEGKTMIRNAYISPEVQDLILFLKAIGIRINTVGNSYIEVFGSKEIDGCVYEVMPDRIEALTWIIYGILSRGEVVIENVPFQSMVIPLIHLSEAGIDLMRSDNNVFINPSCLRNDVIQPFELATGTHPGVISDMQPFYTLLGLHSNGISRIFDYRYPERIKYCHELAKIYDARIHAETGKITTYGNKLYEYSGAELKSTDLRGSMAMIIGALLQDGVQTKIHNAEMALRGYNKLQNKLNSLGVTIDLVQ